MKRTTIDIDENLKKTIEAMAKKENWSFSYMGYVLLQQAVREKLRKSNRDKKNNTEYNASDIRPSHGGG